MTESTKSKLLDIGVSALVFGMAASIPAAIAAAWWLKDPSIATWIVVPLIFFMAG